MTCWPGVGEIFDSWSAEVGVEVLLIPAVWLIMTGGGGGGGG